MNLARGWLAADHEGSGVSLHLGSLNMPPFSRAKTRSTLPSAVQSAWAIAPMYGLLLAAGIYQSRSGSDPFVSPDMAPVVAALSVWWLAEMFGHWPKMGTGILLRLLVPSGFLVLHEGFGVLLPWPESILGSAWHGTLVLTVAYGIYWHMMYLRTWCQETGTEERVWWLTGFLVVWVSAWRAGDLLAARFSFVLGQPEEIWRWGWATACAVTVWQIMDKHSEGAYPFAGVVAAAGIPVILTLVTHP